MIRYVLERGAQVEEGLCRLIEGWRPGCVCEYGGPDGGRCSLGRVVSGAAQKNINSHTQTADDEDGGFV